MYFGSLLMDENYKELIQQATQLPAFVQRSKKQIFTYYQNIDKNGVLTFMTPSGTTPGKFWMQKVQLTELPTLLKKYGKMKQPLDIVKLAIKGKLKVSCDDSEGNPEPSWCLHEDTKIKLLDGTESTIKDLVGVIGKYTYSVDDKGDLVAGKILNVWKSGTATKLLKITLDDGTSFQVTDNHLVMKRTGDYVKAIELSTGDSLMPMYILDNKDGYDSVILNSNKQDIKVHRRIALVSNKDSYIEKSSLVLGGEEDFLVVHHSDFNRKNNTPNNLKWMGVDEHFKFHAHLSKTSVEMRTKISEGVKRYNKQVGKDVIKERYNNPKTKKKLSDSMKVTWDLHPDLKELAKQGCNKKDVRIRKSEMLKQRWADGKMKVSHNLKIKCGEDNAMSILHNRIKVAIGQMFYRYSTGCKVKLEKYFLDINDFIYWYTELKTGKYSLSDTKRLFNLCVEHSISVCNSRDKEQKYHNHKVANIEHIMYTEGVGVYDMEIENYNNFAVSGVIVHNCYYGFKYKATQSGYNYGTPENRFPIIRNPKLKGSVCKHLRAVISALPFHSTIITKDLKKLGVFNT